MPVPPGFNDAEQEEKARAERRARAAELALDERYKHHVSFEDLSLETQEFLVRLRGEEIEEIRDAIDMVRNIRGTARFLRWLIYGMIAVLVGMSMGLESFKKIIVWWRG